MSFTNTQAQSFKAHAEALLQSLLSQTASRRPLNPPHADIMASVVNELGPQTCASIAEAIALSRHNLNDCCPEDIDCICQELDKLITCLQTSLTNEIPPTGNFRDILAKLLEKLGPFIIQALIGFLMQPEPPQRIPYASLN